ncbi:MAG: putative rane protein [Amycolatopsis sp.]|jgi:hypothetical protein|uniref:DUF6541 family protein n=1 Tax=Amycolatopsis sp. TaxID=37632 RepID=UPI00261203F6|nr:DUF6541 family protein [Amycolatopsis sp.]MCU1679523.1 putative rane protein [Amycolatopsis sp.]
MNWLDVSPVALVCVGWLFVPGLLLSYAAGFRSIAAWAVAPALSVAIIAVTAVLAGKLGLSWSVPLVLIVTVLAAVVTGGGAWLLRKRFDVVREADSRPLIVAAFVGLVPAIVLGGIATIIGMGSPDSLSETFDAVFHYNAIAYIIDSRQASSLTLTTLGTPGMPPGFYPGAWHDVASLVVLATGTSIPVAANLLTGVLAVVVWPLSCVLLVRQVGGRSIPAMAITGLVSIGFTAFPWGLMDFGVLWPNLLGLSLIPIGASVAVSLAGLANDDVIGKGRAWLLLPFVVIGGGLAHPNSLFTLAVIMLFPLFTGIGRWALRMRAEGRTARGLSWFAVAVIVLVGAWRVASTTPALATVRTFYWAPFESATQAVGQAVFGSTNGRPALWALAAAMIVGIVLLWKLRDQRWLIGAFAASVFLYVLAAALNTPGTQRFTGYWYNDSNRLAAAIPITAVPLAVLGIVYVSKLLRDKLAERERPLLGRFGASTLGVTLVVTLLVALAGKGMYVNAHITTVGYAYTSRTDSTTNNLVDDRERAFYDKIKKDIPANAVVASNPWDGSALLWALIDRKPLFPHMDLPKTPPQDYLAKHLVDAVSDPTVCLDAKKLGVDFVLIGNQHFWLTDNRRKDYPGIVDPVGRPGFQLVDADGDLKLYKITAC